MDLIEETSDGSDGLEMEAPELGFVSSTFYLCFCELVPVLNVMFTHFYFKLLGASRKKDATDEVRKLIYQT